MLKRIFGPTNSNNTNNASNISTTNSTPATSTPVPSTKENSNIKKEGTLQINKALNDKIDYCYITPRIIVTGRPTSRNVSNKYYLLDRLMKTEFFENQM